MIHRIEPEYLHTNDVLSKRKGWERRRGKRRRHGQEEGERPKGPRREEMAVDLVA